MQKPGLKGLLSAPWLMFGLLGFEDPKLKHEKHFIEQLIIASSGNQRHVLILAYPSQYFITKPPVYAYLAQKIYPC